MEKDNKLVTLKIFRFDPAADVEPHYDTFQIETKVGYSVMNALQYIVENIDPSLAFYASCRIGVCVGCMIRINGTPLRSCSTMLTEDVLLEPLDRNNVMKDLVCRRR